MSFEIGQKVICIDDTIPPTLNMENFKREFPNWVVQDETYTIRDIFHNNDIVMSVVVEELINPILFFPTTINRSQEASFRITRFRELEVEELEESFEDELMLENYN